MYSLWMVAASLFFAGVGLCVKLGASQFSSAELVFYRSFVAFLVILGFVCWKRLPLRPRTIRAHLYRSLAGFTSMVLYFYAISHIPLATAVTLNYTSSLFIAAMVVLWWREPVRPLVHVALVSGFIGIVLLLQPTFNRDQWLPASFGLISGLLSAFAFLNVRALGRQGEPEWRMVFYFSLLSSLAALPWVLQSRAFHAPTWHGAALILGVGVCGVGAQLCMAVAYMRGKALVNASLGYLTVVFSSLFGIAFWDEVLSPISWIGIAMIVGSGIMATVMSRAPSPRVAAGQTEETR